MLVTQFRGATIEAETVCSMWEITQDKALTIIERYPSVLQHFAKVISNHLDLTVSARLLSASVFSQFDKKFKTLLGLYCERHAYFPDFRIVREGQSGDQMFIVNYGSALLQKKTMPIKVY